MQFLSKKSRNPLARSSSSNGDGTASKGKDDPTGITQSGPTSLSRGKGSNEKKGKGDKKSDLKKMRTPVHRGDSMGAMPPNSKSGEGDKDHGTTTSTPTPASGSTPSSPTPILKETTSSKIKNAAHRGKLQLRGMNEKDFLKMIEQIRSSTYPKTTLTLANRNMTKHTAEVIADAITVNRNITVLDVSNNLKIGDEGIFKIGLALTSNLSVTTLDIRSTGLTREGPIALLKCLKNNVHIVNLHMGEPMTDMNQILPGMELSRDTFAPPVRDKLQRLMDSNRKFQLVVQKKEKTLDLSNRRQPNINPKIMRYDHLEGLIYRNNKLTSIPPQIADLKLLQRIDFALNLLTSLPDEIGSLPNLQILLLNRNRLTNLPVSVATLPRLKVLDISFNRCEELPIAMLCGMSRLESLDLRGNPFVESAKSKSMFLKNIVQNGGKETLAFLREQNKGTKDVYRMKLMFVGNGNVGKTSLLDSFIKKDEIKKSRKAAAAAAVPIQFQNVATDGIDIHNWYAPHPSLQDTFIQYSCWDFAGQDVYYATHSFFLSGRSLYLVVFNLAEPLENSRIEYWLQSITARIDSPTVLIVGTHADDKKCTAEYVTDAFDRVHRRFGRRFNLKKPQTGSQLGTIETPGSYFPVSNASGLGLRALRKRIVELTLGQKKYMPESVPVSFHILEERIANEKARRVPPILRWNEFCALAKECTVSEGSITTAAKYFTENGFICYFGDRLANTDKPGAQSNGALNDIIIIEPMWITKTFATIISLKTDFVRKGILFCSDLPQMWRPPNYPIELHSQLVQLLEKFEVVTLMRTSRAKEDTAIAGDPHNPLSASRAVIQQLKLRQRQNLQPTLRPQWCLLIPSLLPDEPPDQEEVAFVWPTVLNCAEEVGRVYSVDFVPNGFFSRLIVRFLLSGDYHPLVYWRTGIILSRNDRKIKLTMTETGENKYGVRLFLWIRGERVCTELINFVESIETLINDWLIVKCEATIMCPACVQDGKEQPYLFQVSDLEKSFTDGVETVTCAGEGAHIVNISQMAPDITMNDFERIPYSEIMVTKKLGEGAYSSVYKGSWRGNEVAVKELNLTAQSMMPRNVFQELRKEVAVMSIMTHQNLVQMLGLCIGEKFCIVLEFMTLGELYSYLHTKENQLAPIDVCAIAQDIANGMHFMHYRAPPIIHRDLKSPNVLLRRVIDPPPGDSSIQAKVADFGFSRKLFLVDTLKEKPIDNPVWLAPELIRKDFYDEKVDVYAFGVILWELMTRDDFFAEISNVDLEDAVLEGKRPAIPEFWTTKYPQFVALVEECWANESKQRPSFDIVCERLRVLAGPEFECPVREGRVVPERRRQTLPQRLAPRRSSQTDGHPATPAAELRGRSLTGQAQFSKSISSPAGVVRNNALGTQSLHSTAPAGVTRTQATNGNAATTPAAVPAGQQLVGQSSAATPTSPPTTPVTPHTPSPPTPQRPAQPPNLGGATTPQRPLQPPSRAAQPYTPGPGTTAVAPGSTGSRSIVSGGTPASPLGTRAALSMSSSAVGATSPTRPAPSVQTSFTNDLFLSSPLTTTPAPGASSQPSASQTASQLGPVPSRPGRSPSGGLTQSSNMPRPSGWQWVNPTSGNSTGK